MTDLAARLRAVVEERLAVARAARERVGHGEWRYATALENHHTWHCIRGGNEVMVCDDVLGEVVGNHIALNDPADVIRACERDLAVLERHAPIRVPGGSVWCSHRIAVGGGGTEERLHEWPCAEITDLATRYRVEVDGG